MAVRLYDGDLACWGGGPWALLTPIKALRVAVGFFKNIRAQKEETNKRFIRNFSSFCTSQVLLLGIALSLLLSLSLSLLRYICDPSLTWFDSFVHREQASFFEFNKVFFSAQIRSAALFTFRMWAKILWIQIQLFWRHHQQFQLHWSI